jgi:hypothetical protein
MIPKGILVRVLTTNGGDTTARLAEPYRHSDCEIVLEVPNRPTESFRIWHDRIKRVIVLESKVPRE